jgi:hypothetical protein
LTKINHTAAFDPMRSDQTIDLARAPRKRPSVIFGFLMPVGRDTSIAINDKHLSKEQSVASQLIRIGRSTSREIQNPYQSAETAYHYQLSLPGSPIGNYFQMNRRGTDPTGTQPIKRSSEDTLVVTVLDYVIG